MWMYMYLVIITNLELSIWDSVSTLNRELFMRKIFLSHA